VVYTLLGRAPVVTQADLERYGTAPARPAPPLPGRESAGAERSKTVGVRRGSRSCLTFCSFE